MLTEEVGVAHRLCTEERIVVVHDTLASDFVLPTFTASLIVVRVGRSNWRYLTRRRGQEGDQQILVTHDHAQSGRGRRL